ncbi:hypothetical protein C8J57DRAFT_1512654 [Mycena rebaudengoi]|nr:hypothetical protein C8J57DRAFT_1512654 [Mycena rebaudengoi]
MPPPGFSTQIAISSDGDQSKGFIRSVQRTSGLDAPIVSLASAHGGEILSCRFDPTGQNIAACSAGFKSKKIRVNLNLLITAEAKAVDDCSVRVCLCFLPLELYLHHTTIMLPPSFVYLVYLPTALLMLPPFTHTGRCAIYLLSPACPSPVTFAFTASPIHVGAASVPQRVSWHTPLLPPCILLNAPTASSSSYTLFHAPYIPPGPRSLPISFPPFSPSRPTTH